MSAISRSSRSALSQSLDGVFVDWLTIYQVHRPGSVPVVGSEFVFSTSVETGEVTSQRVTGFQHEGSHDTRIHVRSDGNVVYVSGNPSAFDRMDNLFGVRSVWEAVEIYNRVLESLGLPSFDNQRENEGMRVGSSVKFVKLDNPVRDKGIMRFFGFRTEQGRQSAFLDALLLDGRPRITRVDLTVNVETTNPLGFLRQLSGYVHQGKAGFLYPNGRTVDWPIAKGLENRYSRRLYHKYYDKVYELQCKLNKAITASKKDPLNLVIKQRIVWLQKLSEWAKSHGIVRREISIKATEIKERGLSYIENWSHEVMTNIIYPYQFHAKLKTEETRLQDVREYLISLGEKPSIANKAEMLHTAWVSGKDVRVLAGSKTTFYRYRKILLGVGVDIERECNISNLVLRVEKFSWNSVEPPEWYKQPAAVVGHIKVAV